MKSGWQNFESRFSALSQREKVLITVCGSVLIVMMLLLGLIEPTLKQAKHVNCKCKPSRQATCNFKAKSWRCKRSWRKSRPRVGCGAEPTDVAKSGDFRAAGGQNDFDGCSVRDAQFARKCIKTRATVEVGFLGVLTRRADCARNGIEIGV